MRGEAEIRLVVYGIDHFGGGQHESEASGDAGGCIAVHGDANKIIIRADGKVIGGYEKKGGGPGAV